MKTLQDAYQDFNLEQLIATQLQGTAQALNAYTECCGRYCGQQHTALIWEGKQGESARWSFDQLAEASGKLANYFVSLPAAPLKRRLGRQEQLSPLAWRKLAGLRNPRCFSGRLPG